MIFNMGGGEAAGLNFRVVGGTTAPSSPAENTIWVNTPAEISDWLFSAGQPEAGEGAVWIRTGASSVAAFNALKNRRLYVYPLDCRQFVSGAWVRRDMKLYDGSAWVDFATYLYNAGDPCTAITGGWTAIALDGDNADSAADLPPSITWNADSVSLSQENNYCGGIRTTNQLDLTNVDTIHFHGTLRTGPGTTRVCRIAVWSDMGTEVSDNLSATYFLPGVSAETQTVTGEVTVDVSSLTGTYYIGLTVSKTGSQITMNAMWLV